MNPSYRNLLNEAMRSGSPCLSGIRDNYLAIKYGDVRYAIVQKMVVDGLLRTNSSMSEDGFQVFYLTLDGIKAYEDHS